VWRCEREGCASERYAYHSCRNRSCPKCHREQTQAWLARHRARLPESSWVLLTFTVPAELRNLARSHQKAVLGALMRSAAAAVLTLCRDPAYLGAVPAILAMLHTWTRAMDVYHPHGHLLVSLGGVDTAGHWVMPRHAEYLVPAKALAFRGMASWPVFTYRGPRRKDCGGCQRGQRRKVLSTWRYVFRRSQLATTRSLMRA
jgi:hypothetical protein